MIEGLKPYPKYKDSGVPWLGQVPDTWDVRRLKYLLREIDVRSAKGEEQLLRVSQYSGVTERSRLAGFEQDTRAASLVGYKIVEPDDLAINIMLAWNGSLGVSRYSGIVSPAYCVYRFRQTAKPEYYHELLRSPAYKAKIKAVSRGVVDSRLRLYTDDLYRLEALVPPSVDQSAIVRFVDHADRKIRRYIAAKRKLIKLLEEEKQAIIHRAVTRGLDPNVRLKPSGIGWLGDIPEHWRMIRSGSMFRLFGGFAFPGNGFVRDESDASLPLLLTPVNFEPTGGLRFGPKSTVRFQGDVPDRFRLRRGDLVTVLTDLSAKRLILGQAGFIDDDGVLLNQRTARIDIHVGERSRLNLEYLFYVLNSAVVRQQTIATSRGSTVFHTSPTRMLAARWPLPPLPEQLAICRGLVMLEKKHRVSRDALAAEIDALLEFRTRLTADVVTGKLDVHEAAAALPDEPEEGPIEDEAEGVLEDDGDLAKVAEDEAA